MLSAAARMALPEAAQPLTRSARAVPVRSFLAVHGGRFLIKHPGWSDTGIVFVALCFGGIPVIGPGLALVLILAGLVGASRFRSAYRRWEVAGTDAPLALPAPAEPAEPSGWAARQPMGSAVFPPSRPTPPPPPVRDNRPSVSELASRLTVDDRPRPLDEQVEVAGETYYVREIKALYADDGVTIAAGKGATMKDLTCLLVPDPWNDFDANAVAIVINGHQVGHLPAELAASYSAPLLRLAEAGLVVPGQARVWAKGEGGMVRARVTLLVPAVEHL